jgi:hypothetical protein
LTPHQAGVVIAFSPSESERALRQKEVFVADAGIGGRRPQGKWRPLFHIISMIAFPLVYAVCRRGTGRAGRGGASGGSATHRRTGMTWFG